MKVIVAGSRSVTNDLVVDAAIEDSGFKITELVSGTARGVDRLGEDWAKSRCIAIKRFPADWNRYGKSAGYRRNVEMAEYADALIAIWDGKSKGTQHMINIAQEQKLKVYVKKVKA